MIDTQENSGAYYILIGPPGAGKSTQTVRLGKALDLPTIGGGDIYREVAASDTEIGRMIAARISKGEYLPDDIAVGVFVERLVRPEYSLGAVIDGFPRTATQARMFDQSLADSDRAIRNVVYLHAPDSVLITRIATGTRWVSRKTGKSFDLSSLTLEEVRSQLDPDDELFEREDDRPEIIPQRLRLHQETAVDILDYYRTTQRILEIDTDRPIEDVTRIILEGVERAMRRRHGGC